MLRALLQRLQSWWSRLFAGAQRPRAALTTTGRPAALPPTETTAQASAEPAGGGSLGAVAGPAGATPAGAPAAPVEADARASASRVSAVVPPDEETLRAAAMGGPRPASSGRGATLAASKAELRGSGEALRADARPTLTVRQFFARVAAAAPGGLQVDFTAWQGASVERFFSALSAPERSERRGPAIAEAVSVRQAFDGFEWD